MVLRDSLYITIQNPHPDSIAQFTRLAGPLTAMVMDCCGCYPLHASGVVIGGRMLAVHGASGCGKSTLAARLAAVGVAIGGDDLLPLDPLGTVHGISGALRVGLAHAPAGWNPVATLPDGRGWFHLAAMPDVPLRTLLLLERGEDLRIVPVRGVERFTAFLRAGFLSHLDPTPETAWHQRVLGLAERIPVYRLVVPGDLEALDAHRDQLVRMLGDLPT